MVIFSDISRENILASNFTVVTFSKHFSSLLAGLPSMYCIAMSRNSPDLLVPPCTFEHFCNEGVNEAARLNPADHYCD